MNDRRRKLAMNDWRRKLAMYQQGGMHDGKARYF